MTTIRMCSPDRGSLQSLGCVRQRLLGIYKSETAGGQFSKIQGIPFSARRTRVLKQDPTNETLFTPAHRRSVEDYRLGQDLEACQQSGDRGQRCDG